jgi:hypothetical protein
MINEQHKKFIDNARETYKKIGCVSCPAFNNEGVYFNRHGFNHLVRKGKNIRLIGKQVERINLIHYAVTILKETKSFNTYKTDAIKGYSAHFWSFNQTIGAIEIRVIVRQLGNGRKHFFSVMY